MINMLKVEVWYEDENGEVSKECLRYLKPRNYMTGWDFDRMLKYVKEECEWAMIDINKIDCITLHNEREQWLVDIKRK